LTKLSQYFFGHFYWLLGICKSIFEILILPFLECPRLALANQGHDLTNLIRLGKAPPSICIIQDDLFATKILSELFEGHVLVPSEDL
jgi:hypothetical protein